MEGSIGQGASKRDDRSDALGVGIGQPSGRSVQEFRHARRHSRWVRGLKIGLPLAASVIVIGALVVTWFARALPADVAFASTSIVDGRLVMQDPRMSGVDGNDRPYSMIAERAIQSLGGTGIDLEGVKANLTVDENTTAELLAAKGRYDTQANMLRLYDDISVDTSSGIKIRLDSADVALSDGRLTGNGPVEISTPSQRLESGNITISNGGKTLSFGNRVKLTLLPTPASTGADAPSSEQTP